MSLSMESQLENERNKNLALQAELDHEHRRYADLEARFLQMTETCQNLILSSEYHHEKKITSDGDEPKGLEKDTPGGLYRRVLMSKVAGKFLEHPPSYDSLEQDLEVLSFGPRSSKSSKPIRVARRRDSPREILGLQQHQQHRQQKDVFESLHCWQDPLQDSLDEALTDLDICSGHGSVRHLARGSALLSPFSQSPYSTHGDMAKVFNFQPRDVDNRSRAIPPSDSGL